MSVSEFGRAEKLRIVAYQSANRLRDGERFESMFDPESIVQELENVFQPNGFFAINASRHATKYSHSKPRKVSFKLWLDVSGDADFIRIDAKTFTSLTDRVDQFLRVCYNYDGEIHEPRYLVIKWGKFTLNARLLRADIKYTMHNREGDPLRAEIDAVFIEDVSRQDRLRLEDKRSPDLTRNYLVRGGDNLPALSLRYYGDPKYYLSLAEFNGINYPRELEPGMDLFLPPLSVLLEVENTQTSL